MEQARARAKKLTKKKYQRTGDTLTHVLYTYVEKENCMWAKEQGKRLKYGTTSGYINALICKDRGIDAPSGLRGQKKVFDKDV